MKKIDKNYKILVTPDQSRKIQEICLSQKIGWGHANEFKIQLTDKQYLFISEFCDRYNMYYCGNDSEYAFRQSPNNQIDADEFIKMYSKDSESSTEKIANKSPYIFKIIKDSNDTDFIKSLDKIYEEYAGADIEVDYKPIFNMNGSITNTALVKIKESKEKLNIG